MLCVRPGVFDVRASPFLSSSEFISEDFPTFDRPRNATSGNPSVVQWLRSKALFTNSAEVIFTRKGTDSKTIWAGHIQEFEL